MNRRSSRLSPVRLLARARHEIDERLGDARLGIHTRGRVHPPESGNDPASVQPYAPTAYGTFRAALGEVRIRPGIDVFLDCGAGMGRVVVLAALHPFRRVAGVEISPSLAAIARENVRRASPRLICREVEIVTGDASTLPFPDDVTLVHLFDPFKGEALARVLEEMRASLLRSPRPLTILYADPSRFAPLASRCGWLEAVRDVPYPFRVSDDPIRSLVRIYKARPA